MILDLALDPSFARAGQLQLTWSGIGAALALAILVWWCRWHESGRSIGWWAVGCGALASIVGARGVAVASHAAYYRANPGEALRLWDGAGDAAIAVLCSGLGMWWAARLRAPGDARSLDTLAAAILGGIACVHVGGFLSGASWGGPTRGDWGIIYWHPLALLPPDLLGVPLHPTPLYQAAGALLLLALTRLDRRSLASAGWGWRVGLGGYALLSIALVPFLPTGAIWQQIGVAALFAASALAAPAARKSTEMAGHVASGDQAPAARWRTTALLAGALLIGLGQHARPVPESPGRWEPSTARAVALDSTWIVGYAIAAPRVGDRISTGLYLGLAEAEGRWVAAYLERQALALARSDAAAHPPGVVTLLRHYRALVGAGAPADAEAALRRLLTDQLGPALRRQAEDEIARLRARQHAPGTVGGATR